MRFDRLFTLYFFHPLGQMIRLRDEVRIPILMYHSISNDNENGVHPYYRISFFKAKLYDGYDWLNKLQYVSKLIKK